MAYPESGISFSTEHALIPGGTPQHTGTSGRAMTVVERGFSRWPPSTNEHEPTIPSRHNEHRGIERDDDGWVPQRFPALRPNIQRLREKLTP